jgi:hypothetical protein
MIGSVVDGRVVVLRQALIGGIVVTRDTGGTCSLHGADGAVIG